MRPVGSEDYFEVKAFSLISDSDIGICNDLYMPLVGVTSFAIYSSLVHESRYQEEQRSHAFLLAKLQLTSGQFQKGIEALEAVGLVKTYFRKLEGKSYFLYGIYAPKDPASYFQNPLLLGTLRRYIGEDEVQRLVRQYKIDVGIDGYEEVTGGFCDYFNPDFSDPVYAKSTIKAMPHKSGKIKTSFDYSLFENEIKGYGVNPEAISRKELSQIEKYASLYGYDGKEMASIATRSYDASKPFGKHIDMVQLEKMCMSSLKFGYVKAEKGEKSQISSNSPLAAKIKMMDEITPIEFLSILQGMKKPARSDMKIVMNLSTEIGLPNPAINALIDYVLQKNNNVLSSAYCEKLGAYLVREGVKTSRDAMDKLVGGSKRGGDKPKQDTTQTSDIKTETQEPSKKVENADEELEAFLKELYGDQQ